MPKNHLDSLDVEKRTEQWQRSLQNGKTLVAESDDTIVGFCSVAKARDEDLDEATGEIYALYVDPRLWRGGTPSTEQVEISEWISLSEG